MAKRPALGKGIGALLTSASQDSRHKFFVCPVEELKPHHQQPRKTFNDAKMSELVASIREKGVIQPLVVRHTGDHYQIIAGERRWRAAQKAGLKEVPVVIQDVSEDWALEMALIENIQREDLNPIEEAEAYKHLMGTFDLSQEEVAKRVGRERPTVANALRLLRLPKDIQLDVIGGQLSMGHARALLALDSAGRIKEARDQVVKKQFSVRQTEALVKKLKGGAGNTAPRKAKIDPELADLAARLQRSIGTKVSILPQARGGKGGKIEISYYSAEELERLLEFFERV
jgi:ParB family chromosome partitioning protein